MVICKFFLKGICKNRKHCNFDHCLDFKAMKDELVEKVDEKNYTMKFEKIIDINMIVKVFQDDLLSRENFKQSVLSSYGPFGEKPSYPGFEDQSFEEIRMNYNEAKENNTLALYTEQIEKNQSEIKSKLKALQTPTDEIINTLKEIYNYSEETTVSHFDFGQGEKCKTALKTALESFDATETKTKKGFSKYINFSHSKLGYIKVTDINSLITSVREDLLLNERGKVWDLTCYAPLINRPLYPGFEDHSFEEVRLGFYEAQNSGTCICKYEKKVEKLVKKTKRKFKQLQKPTEAMIAILDNIFTNKMDLTDVDTYTFQPMYSNTFVCSEDETEFVKNKIFQSCDSLKNKKEIEKSDKSLSTEDIFNILYKKIDNLENSFHTNLMKDLRNIVKELKQENKNLREHNKDLQQKMQRLLTEMSAIKEKRTQSSINTNSSNIFKHDTKTFEEVKKRDTTVKEVQDKFKTEFKKLHHSLLTLNLESDDKVEESILSSNKKEKNELNLEQLNEIGSAVSVSHENITELTEKMKQSAEQIKNENNKDYEKYEAVLQALSSVGQYISQNNIPEKGFEISEEIDKKNFKIKCNPLGEMLQELHEKSSEVIYESGQDEEHSHKNLTDDNNKEFPREVKKNATTTEKNDKLVQGEKSEGKPSTSKECTIKVDECFEH